jgi:hypothetical protein
MMTCTAPTKSRLGEPFLKALPARRNYKKPWHPTQASPCPLLMQCNTCKEYLPFTAFYTLRKSTRIARRDILGKDHAASCIACMAKNYPSLDPRRKLFYGAKRRAVEKGLVFEITPEDIVIPERCPVLGIRLKAAVGCGTVSVARLESSPTLDRIDNTKGYTPDNIAVISLRANNLKRDANLYEMRCLAYHMSKPCAASAIDRSAAMNTLTLDAVKGKECSVDMRNYYKTDHRVKLLRAIRKRGKTYGFDGSITAEDIVIPEYCPVLGIKLFPSVGKGVKALNNFYNSPSVDRIDSRKGYTKENIQIVSFRANCLKRDASLWEVRALVDYMENYRQMHNCSDPLPNDTTTEPEVTE